MPKDKKRKALRVAGNQAGLNTLDWHGTDFENIDEIKEYLTENMAEGYLAQEEEAFIEELMSNYREAIEIKQKSQEFALKIQENKVI